MNTVVKQSLLRTGNSVIENSCLNEVKNVKIGWTCSFGEKHCKVKGKGRPVLN
jgi:hypothetical protein